MKNLIKLTSILVLCVAFLSCKKDKIETPVPSSIVTYNNTNFTLANGVIYDYGYLNVFGNSNTHYNYDFYLTDGNIEYSTNGEISDIKGKIAVYAELLSAGATGGFKAGTYTFIDDTGDGNLSATQLRTKYDNKNFFSFGYILIGNDNINASLGNVTEIEVKSGTITVSGTSPNFSLDLDLTLTNNRTVKGSYNSTFKLVQ